MKKKILCLIIAAALFVGLLPTVAFAAGSPGDYGWHTDNNNYAGWSATDAANITLDYPNAASHRVWKELLTNTNDFSLDLDLKGGGYVRLLGQTIELDPNGGDGNQVCLKVAGTVCDWTNAEGLDAHLTIARKDGGNITVALSGKGDNTPQYAACSAASMENYVELGAYRGETITFSNISYQAGENTDPGDGLSYDKSPASFGWQTDNDDYSGWAAADAANLKLDYASSSGNHRVWKALLTNQNDFTLDMDMKGDATCSQYLRLLGVTIEANSTGGSGNQTCLFIDGSGDWIDALGTEIHIKVERSDAGKLNITATGKGNPTPRTVSVAAKEENENVEVGAYRGSVMTFKNISVQCGNADDPAAVLRQAIVQAEDLKQEDYTEESWAVLATAVANGKALLDKEGATKEEYDAAAAAITDAIAGLVKIPKDEPKTPGDFGWNNDEDNFAGWVADDEANFSATQSEVVFNRVWKPLFKNPNGFTVELDMIVGVESSGYIKVKDSILELDSRHSGAPGTEVCVKSNGIVKDWFPAKNNKVHVIIDRTNGDVLKVKLIGDGNEAPMEFAMIAVKEDSENVEVGIYAGTIRFEKISAKDKDGGDPPITPPTEPTEDGKFGWHNDSDLFNGWSFQSETSFSANGSSVVFNRVWKPILGSTSSYSVTTTLIVGKESSGYVKVQGAVFELDSRHSGAPGTEVCIKVNGEVKEWLPADGNEVSIRTTRSGGQITAVFIGKGNPVTQTYTSPVIEADNENYELGIYAGTVSYLVNYTTDNGPDSVGKFGWRTDENNYTGWTFNSATSFSANAANVVNHRVWKPLLGNLSNYSVTTTITLGTDACAYVRVQGVVFEIDSRHSGAPGTEVCVKVDGIVKDWLPAEGNEVSITVSRTGGDITAVFTGKGNDKPQTHTVPVREATGDYYELGVYAGFASFSVNSGVSTKPSDDGTQYGWQNDKNDYTGWTFENSTNFSADADEVVYNRVWKNVFASQDNFTVSFYVDMETESSAYFKVKGVTFETDSRHGNGQQVCLKIDGESQDWLDAKDRRVYITITRTNGGDLTATFRGDGNENAFTCTVAPSELDNENLELGVYAGKVSFHLDASTIVEHENPKTGDTRLIWLYIVLTSVFGLGLIALLVIGKKKQLLPAVGPMWNKLSGKWGKKNNHE